MRNVPFFRSPPPPPSLIPIQSGSPSVLLPLSFLSFWSPPPPPLRPTTTTTTRLRSASLISQEREKSLDDYYSLPPSSPPPPLFYLRFLLPLLLFGRAKRRKALCYRVPTLRSCTYVGIASGGGGEGGLPSTSATLLLGQKLYGFPRRRRPRSSPPACTTLLASPTVLDWTGLCCPPPLLIDTLGAEAEDLARKRLWRCFLQVDGAVRKWRRRK